MAKQTIITRRLNLADFLRFSVLSLVRNADIYYDEHRASRMAQGLADLCRRFHPAHLDFNKKTPDGLGLLYEFQENINAVLTDVMAPAGALPEWLRQALFWDARSLLEYELVFIESALFRAAELGLEHPTLYGLSTPFFPYAQRFYASKGVSIKALPSMSALKLWTLPLLRFCLKRSSAKAASTRPAVWVEYSRPGVFEHAFWRQHLKNRDFDIVYFLDRRDTPIIPRIIQAIDESDVPWIDLHASSLMGSSGLTTRQMLVLLWGAFRTPGLAWAVRALLFKYQLWHASYVGVFRKRRVKMLMQHQDRSWTQAVQAHALAEAGGILFGFHWSNLPYCMKDWFITAQQVYFVWGKNNYESLMRKGNTCRHILPSGLWIEESAMTDSLREFAAHPGFKIAVFDSDTFYYLYQSPRTLAEFFNAVLDLIEKHADWKALFKFKSSEMAYLKRLPGGDRIADRSAALKQAGRILVADANLSPITAAKCADLSVCYVFNSAGICAQIRGARAVHWDATGIRYPLLQETRQKTIFSGLEATMQAVEQFAAGDKSIGDLSPWRAQFDYFGDTKGAERIAEFIGSYMSAFRAQPDANGLQIADDLAEKYIQQHHVKPEFFKTFTFWT